MKDVMIDVETLGNGKNALLIQIGAVYFDRHTGEIGDGFKVNIDAIDCGNSGGEFDADTVYWWLSQSREAIDSVIAEPREKIGLAMVKFCAFLCHAEAVWSHATFDFVIIQETLKRLGLPPLKYKLARDIRTLVDLAGINTKKYERLGIHHDALDDCNFQIKYCVDAMQLVSRAGVKEQSK